MPCANGYFKWWYTVACCSIVHFSDEHNAVIAYCLNIWETGFLCIGYTVLHAVFQTNQW